MPHVVDVASAKAFLAWAIEKLGDNYHPDNSAFDYTGCNAEGEPCFMTAEAKLFDEENLAMMFFIDVYMELGYE